MLELLSQILQLFTDLIPRPIKVGPTEKAVRVRCGRWLSVMEPGVYVYWPVTTDIDLYPVNSQLVETSILSARSNDGVSYQVRLVVEYCIRNPMYFHMQSQDSQLHVELLAGAEMVALVNANDSLRLLRRGNRAACARVHKRIRDELLAKGVDVIGVRAIMWSTAIPVFLSQAERLAD